MLAIFVDVAVLLFIVVFGIIVATQIVVPSLRGTKLFPMFRKRVRTLQQAKEELTTEELLNTLEQEVEALRNRVHPLKDKLDVTPPM